MILDKKKLKKIKGDASFRVFYRKKNNKKNSIIVYARKEKKKNLLIYDAVNKLLIKNNILAPKLYSECYRKNFIEIEDFGNNTVFKLLKKNSVNKIHLYKSSIDLLNKIQKIKQNKIKNFRNKIYKLPKYEKKELFAETKLFSLWYAQRFIPKKKLAKFNIIINKQIKILLSSIKIKNNVFVHRDFHVSNLMGNKKELRIIDTQDALLGNKAYDLASLIDDVRFKTNSKFKDQIYNYFIKSNKNLINKKNFLNDFEILSVLRNMKIIGIFTRLAKRDNKKKYLTLIPHAWELIELRMKKNKKFKSLKELLDKNFSKKIRCIK
jgi:N-acetylmuramate 1-kinase|tara:strand:+ start:473 stop:1438 length:966 start_codon:yes stop_codon:yes gene_type:complete